MINDEDENIEYERKQAIRDEGKIESLQKFLSERGGRDFMFDLMDMSGTFKAFGISSAEEANFNNGRRYVGCSILETIKEINPDIYLTMMKENKQNG